MEGVRRINGESALINREALLTELQQAFNTQAAEALLNVLDQLMAQMRQAGIAREDFRELKQIVADLAKAQQRLVETQARTEERGNRLEGAIERLAEAQARTEERIGQLEGAMERLAEAQARTEERVGQLEGAMERLAEAQARTEERVGQLEGAMERLAEAQARTEERVGRLEGAIERLAEAQARTEERVNRLEGTMEKLAEAQRQTSVAIAELTESINRLQKQVGGLSDTVGGDIEDIAYIVLHDVLKREFGWDVGVLERSWQTWGKRPEEVNVFGQATDPARPGQVIWIVGEAKHNLTVKEVRKFIRQVERARQRLVGEVFAVCFCYRARPEVQQIIRNAGIRLVFSYGKLV